MAKSNAERVRQFRRRQKARQAADEVFDGEMYLTLEVFLEKTKDIYVEDVFYDWLTNCDSEETNEYREESNAVWKAAYDETWQEAFDKAWQEAHDKAWQETYDETYLKCLEDGDDEDDATEAAKDTADDTADDGRQTHRHHDAGHRKFCSQGHADENRHE